MLCLSSSWENYTSLFERVFSVDDDDNNLDRLDLPVQWLWDMVDEFVYQYSDFARFRSKDLKKISLSDDDVDAMRWYIKTWGMSLVVSLPSTGEYYSSLTLAVSHGLVTVKETRSRNRIRFVISIFVHLSTTQTVAAPLL